jgi:hexosaminidase
MFNIVPQPVNILTSQDKKGFTLHTGTIISPYPFVDEFISFVRKTLNKKVYVHEDTGEERSIILKLDDSVEHDEGYTIKCENRRVYINAKTEAGLFYGLQTLKQMLLQTQGRLPYTEISDYPRFAYRGYMLDCGRYFYTVDEVKKIVDLMALHKLNALHWHLTEDQGWRIEIKKYPLLTEKGSKRSHTNFNHKPHGGYYTQNEVKEIVKYCHDRKIRVIPEFDIPGHSVAAISCYPYLSCLDRKLEVATHWGVKHDILCAGKETTYKFVYDIIDELIELFPDKVIHIGGDEAVKMRWGNCPHCQKAIKDNGLSNEDELQILFMNKVNEYLKSKGYSSIIWSYDKIENAGSLNSDIAWTVCGMGDDKELVEQEIKRGRKLINTHCYPYYFDFPYGWNSLKRVCDDDGALTDDDNETMGIEAQMWTEYVPDMKRLEFLTFPRLGAMAENAWAEKGYPSFNTFVHKIADYYKMLDVYKVGYAPLKKACPSFVYKHASSLWFKRRVFHWQGLHNLIDDAKAKKEAEALTAKLQGNK